MIQNNFISHLEDFYSQNSNKGDALKMKAYMKQKFDYHGIKAPVRKAFFKELWSEYKEDILVNWPEYVNELWKRPFRENQYIAMDIMAKIERKVQIEHLSIVEKCIVNKSWWDTVDFLASHMIGQILSRDIEFKYKTAERYIQSDNLWLKRTAIIFQLFYKQNTDKELLFVMIDQVLGTKEFFLNKAAGWALRQYSRTDREAVREYVDLQRGMLSNLTIREATKYL